MAAKEVTELSTKAEFDAAISQGKVVVDFSAAWCPPCKAIAPYFKALQGEHPDIKFYTVDVDENCDAAAAEGIQAMPTFITYHNGARGTWMQGGNKVQLKGMLTALDSK